VWAGVFVSLVIVPFVASGNPLLAVVLVGTVAILATAVLRPLWLLWASVLTLIVVPTYIRFPLVPGLPPLPVALVLLAALCGILVIASTLEARGIAPLGADGRRFAGVLLLFAFVLLLSLVDPRTGVNSVDFWIKIVVVPSMLCYAMLRLVRSASDLRTLFLVVVVGSLVAAVYALGEFVSGTNLVLQYFEGKGEERDLYWEGEDFAQAGVIHRTYSLFTNPIEFGALMSMVYPYAMLRVVDARSIPSRVASSVVVLLLLLGATLSFSRGPMLAVLVTTVGLGVVLPQLRRPLAIAATTCAVALVAVWPWFGDRVVERVTDVPNVTLRLKLWSIAAHMAADHPLLGVGLGNFPEYQFDTIRNNRIDTRTEPNALRIRTSENFYLQLAAETGALGLLAFLFLIVTTTRLALGLRRRIPPGEANTLLFASVGALVAYAVNALTVVVYQFYVITVVCGLAFGALLILDRIHPRAST
jgi:hypothetical protein